MIFLLILFGNVWIWKMLSFNIFIGSLVILVSAVSFVTYKNNHKTIGLAVLMFTLVLVQIKTTNVKSLVALSETQKIQSIQRMSEYPPVYVHLFGKTVWIPAARWFEQRHEYRIITRLGNNFSEVIDPNLYFIASHPRETDSIESFEKFPFIALPLFALGLVGLIKGKNFMLLVVLGILPLVVSILVGTRNPVGPISLFPLFWLAIYIGADKIYTRFATKKPKVMVGLVVLYILVFVQTIIYALN
ncbi:MAG: hypothetical protein AAB546_02790 [Patescibacteria group bacterium]